MFKFKEDILTFFIGNKLQLSRYDHKFVTNLYILIDKTKKITTNQATLFDKLISKYQKQLHKKGYVASELLSLNWKISVSESSIEYTGAKIFLSDNNIVIKVPFNKKFINKLKPQSFFVWDNTDKVYKANFTTKALKFAVNVVPEIFEHVSHCSNITNLLEQLKNLDSSNNSIWNPTLVSNDNFYFVKGINETLNKVIEPLQLSDDPKLLFTLSGMGISVDKTITQNDPLKKFASDFVCTIDIDNLIEVRKYLELLGIETVYATRNVFRNTLRHDIKKSLNNISILPLSEVNDQKNIVVINYGTINFGMDLDYIKKQISKVILITNSRPIHIQ